MILLTLVAFLACIVNSSYSLNFYLTNLGNTLVKFSFSTIESNMEVTLDQENKKRTLDIPIISEKESTENIITVTMETGPDHKKASLILNHFYNTSILDNPNANTVLLELIGEFYNDIFTCKINTAEFKNLNIIAVNMAYSLSEFKISFGAIQGPFITEIRPQDISDLDSQVYCC